jgi:crossover junction endodeoxyribonuclease RuvC
MEEKMIILGVDPGLQICGYAILESNSDDLLEAGTIRSNSKNPIEQRLVQIAEDLESLYDRFDIGVVAIEKLFSHYNHPQTAVLMGHARGVIMLTAAKAGARVENFAATKIKKSLTGNGQASKEQMQRAIMTEMRLTSMPQPPDVADAIAVALCCSSQSKLKVYQ